MQRFLLGIDVGSTTAKVALVDPDKRLAFAEYRRHFAEQGNCVRIIRRFPTTDQEMHLVGVAGLLGDQLLEFNGRRIESLADLEQLAFLPQVRA